MRVHIVCQNHKDDRVIPRMARTLAERLGWGLGAAVDPRADVVYLLAYFEAQRLRPWPSVPVAAYFTHREEEPKGNAKARLYDRVAAQVQLRVAMCRLYADPLEAYGPTVVPPLPVERERFTVAPGPLPRGERGRRPVVGLSGYTYANHRKGEDLVKGLLASTAAQRCEWRASGQGWPVPTRMYSWAEMPSFYQSLDVLVCPSRVEGGPMPVLEALACGVRVVVPKGVGIIDELPEVEGIHRYERGDLASLLEAFEAAAFPQAPADREELTAAVAGHSVEAFMEAHRQAFAELFAGAPALDAGIAGASAEASPVVVEGPAPPLRERGTGARRGVYCVAFGEPARHCAQRLMQSIKKHMPDIPIALCAAKAIGPEDVLVVQPDSDVGGRRAKLRAYELAPAEWQAVLYLDADTELLAPVYEYFEWVEGAWDLAIARDVQTVEHLAVRSSPEEQRATLAVASPDELAYNGGVWSFKRSGQVARFFARWLAEWERWGQRDQGALLRALHAEPIKVLALHNDWNSFPKFQPHREGARIVHWPGAARRWDGAIRGRLDSENAWRQVRLFEAKRAAQLACLDDAGRPAVVRVKVGPGRYVRCRPGEEEAMRQRYGAQRERRG